MRELTFQEQEQASGGLFPLFGWAAASAGVASASYGMARSFGRRSGGRGGGRIVDTGSSCAFAF